MERPTPEEYHQSYAAYVELVPEEGVLSALTRGIGRTLALLDRVPEEEERFRYAPEKWSVREVVGHLIDSERLFSFRALHIARDDPAPLPGMDQETWAAASNAHERPLNHLAAELEDVRRSTVHLFRSLDPAVHLRRGIASGHLVTVRALAAIVAGHEAHHRRVLEERYLAEIEGNS